MMRSAKFRRGRRQSNAGQAMTEFALVVIFIVLLMVGVLQMILLMYAYSTLADAAKEGVRYAIVHGTGAGAASCSGPGTVASVTPGVSCSDSSGTNVVNAVIGGNSTCAPTCGWASLSFQNISTTNNACSTSSGNSIDVCYDPGSANTNNPLLLRACSQPGCQVKVTVSHTYSPLFGLGWPTFTLHAAASGTIAN